MIFSQLAAADRSSERLTSDAKDAKDRQPSMDNILLRFRGDYKGEGRAPPTLSNSGAPLFRIREYVGTPTTAYMPTANAFSHRNC